MAMRLYLLAALVAAARSQCPDPCTCAVTDELEYSCGTERQILVRARKNEYINVECKGTNFTCADVPSINLANNKTLLSVSIKKCPPLVLQCLNRSFHAHGAQKLNLVGPTEPIAEQDVAGFDAVDYIMIRDGVDASIPPFLLTLPSLKDLRIQGSPLTLQSSTYVNSSSPIQFLELSTDEIDEIPSGSFEGFSQLKRLNVWGNKCGRLEAGALKGLSNLTLLNLADNQLSTIDKGAFQDTPNLQSIYLTRNLLKEVPEGLFGGLEQLQTIEIKMNQIPLTIGNHAFFFLPSLKHLLLSYSNIQNISETALFGSKSISQIDLDYNDITVLPEKVFTDQENLITLNLNNNRLKMLSERIFVSLKKLETLNLDRNHLETLPDFLFSGLRNLKTVSLNHNFLKTFSVTTFQGAISLETLSIENNQLLLRNELDIYSNFEQTSPFSSLVQLKRLLLSGNRLDTIFNDWQMVLLKLETLDLKRNKYTDLEPFDVQFLSNNIQIDLRDNQITAVNLNYAYPSPTTPTDPPKTNSVILLGNNPLNCNCQLFQLIQRLHGAKSNTIEPKFDVGNAYCDSPGTLKKRLVRDLNPRELTCEIIEECPFNCTSCVERPFTNSFELNCKGTPKEIPEIPGHTVILRVHKQPTSLTGLNVNTLNLTGLGIKTVNFKPVPELTVVDFSNNNLIIPPVDFLNSNISLFLAKNPFECECRNLDEISLLKNSNFVIDFKNVTCENGASITELDITALCGTRKAAIMAVTTFVILLIILAIILALIIKYSTEIKVYMAYKSVFRKIFVIDDSDCDKKYDVFVSFSHKDIDFVDLELIPKLEDEFKQKVCIHSRDWNVGEFITTQINRSIENSRKTIIVLSKNFLNSTWANVEFNVAHNLTVKDNVARIILILLEDVTRDENLTSELKAYINTNTYLMYGDPKFWQKLKRALPQTKVKFVWQTAPKTMDSDKPKGGLQVELNSNNQLVNMAVKEV